ncbi:hypothetical protein Z949_1544 [Sulfitobacter guttiformis KCTC 32187]|uniref:Uncharacterized protein n=1 Tax=Sulfitobacter guttiformis TaxID=74349 RepID=A0A420DI15_9RHOB|nr:hypothetical protein Z949_1544 [Sulfitobacter guttiformis KCTC 32187]RKE93873.1 hypothetical protein C8N30_2974 [Sulfitobacter guttiformis]
MLAQTYVNVRCSQERACKKQGLFLIKAMPYPVLDVKSVDER